MLCESALLPIQNARLNLIQCRLKQWNVQSPTSCSHDSTLICYRIKYGALTCICIRECTRYHTAKTASTLLDPTELRICCVTSQVHKKQESAMLGKASATQ